MSKSFESEDYVCRMRDNLVFLSENTTNLEKILIHLIQDGVIAESEKEEIVALVGSDIKNAKMYHLIMKKGKNAYEKLCNILKESSNSHILEKLNDWNPQEDISKRDARNAKLKETANFLAQLHPTDVRKLNTMLLKDKSSKSKMQIMSAESADLLNISTTLQKNVFSQTDSIDDESAVAIPQINTGTTYPQYILHDEKVAECPLRNPTTITQLFMYHVEMDGSTFRKFLKLIRGLEVFKYFNFSPGGEISLLDMDLLHDCNLLELTYKNINLFFDGRTIKSFQNVTDLHLWMCTLDEDFVDVLSTYFPALEYIDIRGCVFGKQGGVNSNDFKNLLSISHIKRVYISPWTNPAFHGDISGVLKTILSCPSNPWTLYIERDENYDWNFVGYKPIK